MRIRHVHTCYSTDAGMLGNTLGPLDFLVVADHALIDVKTHSNNIAEEAGDNYQT